MGGDRATQAKRKKGEQAAHTELDIMGRSESIEGRRAMTVEDREVEEDVFIN